MIQEILIPNVVAKFLQGSDRDYQKIWEITCLFFWIFFLSLYNSYMADSTLEHPIYLLCVSMCQNFKMIPV